MRGVNKVIIVGRLGNDPITRQFANGGSVTNISVATSEQWTDKQTGERREATEWHRISFFGKLADIAGNYLKKGSAVYVEGSLRTNKYTDQNGIERYSTEVRAETLQMLDGNPNYQNNNNGGYNNNNFNNQNNGGFNNNYNNNGGNRYPNNYQNNYQNQGQPNQNQQSHLQNQSFSNPYNTNQSGGFNNTPSDAPQANNANAGYESNSFMQNNSNNTASASDSKPATPPVPKTEASDDDIPF